MDNPLEFIDENDKFTDPTLLAEVLRKKYEANGMQIPPTSKFEKEQKQFLKKTIALMKAEKTIPNEMNLWPDIAAHLGVDKNTYSVIAAFANFYRSFNESLKLPNIIIHAIVYQGEKERLPYVFETLNTSSVSLTKYEVFSSQWPSLKVVISDEELINKVWSKYDSLKKSSSFNVDVDLDTIREHGMTLFEYCFGFSELVCDTQKPYAFLFNKEKKSTNPTGFELLALACGLHVNKADVLWKDDYLGGSSGVFLLQLKDALLHAINIVADALREWLTDFRNTIIKNTSTYQVYYMIISVFRKLYVFDSKNNVIHKNEDNGWIQRFRKNASKWYLYQTLTGYWNQHRQVNDLHALLHDTSDVDYSTSITKETWNNALAAFCESNKDNCTTKTVPNETKLLLNFLYKLLLKEDANRAKYFKR